MSGEMLTFGIVGFYLSLFGAFFTYHKYIIGYITSQNDKQEKEFERELEIAKKDIEKKLDREIYDREKKIIDEWRKEKDEQIQKTLDKIEVAIKELTTEIRKSNKTCD